MFSWSRRTSSTSRDLLLIACAFVNSSIAQETKPIESPDIPQAPTSPNQAVEFAAMDLGTALNLAGTQNPELLLARQRVIESVALRQLAAAKILPDINAGTNIDAHNGPLQQSNGNILNTNRDALYFGLGTNAVAAGTVNIPGISYNLNVGQAWFDYLRSRQEVRKQQFETQAVNNQVLLKVCMAYTDLLRAMGLRAIVQRNRDEGAEVALDEIVCGIGPGSKLRRRPSTC